MMWITNNRPKPLLAQAKYDKENASLLRPSPNVAKMYRITDADGTIWAFSKKSQMKYFVTHRSQLERRAKHFLSIDELLELNGDARHGLPFYEIFSLQKGGMYGIV